MLQCTTVRYRNPARANSAQLNKGLFPFGFLASGQRQSRTLLSAQWVRVRMSERRIKNDEWIPLSVSVEMNLRATRVDKKILLKGKKKTFKSKVEVLI